jgi:hypothetical protein
VPSIYPISTDGFESFSRNVGLLESAVESSAQGNAGKSYYAEYLPDFEPTPTANYIQIPGVTFTVVSPYASAVVHLWFEAEARSKIAAANTQGLQIYYDNGGGSKALNLSAAVSTDALMVFHATGNFRYIPFFLEVGGPVDFGLRAYSSSGTGSVFRNAKRAGVLQRI